MTNLERLLDELRPVSFAIAYRMLGSVSEDEDVVQEALLRVHQALDGGQQIASARAFVATVTTRLAINELHSARVRRERYVGEWLPEPIVTHGHDDPAQHAEMADSLSLSMLVLLESLSPEQRAVLLLHDVFDYDHAQIAQMIGKTQDNVRQLATRARRHVEQRRPRFQTTRQQRDELARRFFGAAEQADHGRQVDRQPRQARPPRPNSQSALPAAHTSARQPVSDSRSGNTADSHRTCTTPRGQTNGSSSANTPQTALCEPRELASTPARSSSADGPALASVVRRFGG
jgi:RNA polymerase sigma factor (sigma-70 family)